MYDLVLIHGATGTPADFDVIRPHLEGFSNVHPYTQMGHGGRPMPTEFTIDALVADMRSFFQERGLTKAAVFAHSAGAYPALLLAHRCPEIVTGVVTMGGLYFPEGIVITDESEARYLAMLEPIAEKIAPRHHPQDWRDMARANLKWGPVLAGPDGLKPADYASLTTPTLIIAGEDDKIALIDDARRLNHLLPRSRFRRFGGTAHPIRAVPFITIAQEIERFLADIESVSRTPMPAAQT